MLNPEIVKLVEKYRKYKSLLFLTVGITSVCIAAVPAFQDVTVYKIPNNIKHGTPTIKIDRQFDRIDKKAGSNWVQVSEINQSSPYLKLVLSVSGIIFTSISLALVLEEEKTQPIKEYSEAIAEQKEKIGLDFSIATHQVKARIQSEIEQVELHTELYKNPIAKEIFNQRLQTENGEPDTDTSEEDNSYLFEEVQSEKRWFTELQIEEILNISRENGLKNALDKVVPGYSPTHAHWKEIQTELLLKIKELKKDV